MTALINNNHPKKILVVSPFYEKTDKLLSIKKMIPDYDLIVFNGGISEPYDNFKIIRKHIDILNEYFHTQKVVYNLDTTDLQLRSGLLYDPTLELGKWLYNCPNVVIITFGNQNKLIITNGGITPKMSLKLLEDNVETTFVSSIDGKPWHHSYNGRFGYVISNEPLTLTTPQFYNYSAQIGNFPNNKETQVYAQEIDQYGLRTTILL